MAKVPQGNQRVNQCGAVENQMKDITHYNTKGKFHCEDGPALQNADSKGWYIDGECIFHITKKYGVRSYITKEIWASLGDKMKESIIEEKLKYNQ
jgi:hypothetical protein